MRNVFIFFIMLLTTVSVSQPYFNYPIDTLASDQYYNYRAMVKYDNDGFIHVVNTRQYSTQNETREIFYWNNKTGSFLPLQLTNNNVDDNYSSIAFDEDGYTHIGWERRDASNLFQLIYTNNRATGDTFNLPVWITSGGINKATPYMAMGKGDSSVHFAYLTYPMTGTGNAYYRKFNYISNELGPEIVLGQMSPSSENDIQIAIDSNGIVHIVYTTNETFFGGELHYFTNESGTMEEISTGVTATTQYPAITIDKLTNRVLIIYRVEQGSNRVIYLISRELSGNFTNSQAITTGGLGRPSFYRSIDTDNEGNLFVTFQNSVSKAPKGFFLIFGKPGFVFSPPVLIFEDSTSTYIARGNNSVTARGNGLITVSFDPAASRNGTIVSDIMLKTGQVDFSLGIVQNQNIQAGEFLILQNYPNPFNPETEITFQLNKKAMTELSVFDNTGRQITTLVNEILQPGNYSYKFNASGLASGVYFYRLVSGDHSVTKQMILLK
ncbi:MAG: Peptidase S8 and S53, subtilisin, kexin, sedolisin [Chlorobi bacterium OLB4]|nr:MAG: Peptidase S8 and S53, subtilisin, kexin, sedolisin [Chlorobi bacterium OLB4]OQY77659.1 MAG: hypothetical protein B6D43_03915 [Ignavibacteriales bacterium UTCHB1]